MSEHTGNQNKKYGQSIIKWLIVIVIIIIMVSLEHSGIISFGEVIDSINIIDFGIMVLVGICCTYAGISLITHSIMRKSTNNKNDKEANISDNKADNKTVQYYILGIVLSIFGIWMIINQLQAYNIVKLSFDTSRLLLYLAAFATALILWGIGYNDTRLLNKGFCKLSDLEKIRARCVSFDKYIENNNVYYKAVYEYSVSCENHTYVARKKYKENNKPDINSYIEVYYSRDKNKAVTRRDFYKGIRYIIYGVVILFVTIYMGINVGV